MIHGQQGAQNSGEQAGSVWSIAMSTAMGNGIVPRATDEQLRTRPAFSWPWSRTRSAAEAMAIPPRA